MTLRLLQDIRGDLSSIKERQEEHTKQFKKLRKELSEWKETSATAAGFAVHSNVRQDGVDERLDALAERIERLEKKK